MNKIRRRLPKFRTRRRAKAKSGFSRFLVRIAKYAITAIAVVLLACTVNLLYLRAFNPWFTGVQAQRRIEAAFSGAEYSARHQFVPLESIPIHLQHAVIVAEDGAFYKHQGIDWDELEIIWRQTLSDTSRLRGGSTISQQLTKNLFLTTHRSLIRKTLEFALVPLTESILSKDRILELYLNEVEWGPGVWGIEAAAQYHYRISATRLSRNQAARLAACLPAPRTRVPQEMDEYAAKILGRLSSRGW